MTCLLTRVRLRLEHTNDRRFTGVLRFAWAAQVAARLLHHRCTNSRHGPDEIYRWEFDNGKQSLTVSVNGPLIVTTWNS
jgi:hypothetical protein